MFFLHHGGHGVTRSFFLCPPDGKFILRETLRYSVVSFFCTTEDTELHGVISLPSGW